MMHAHRCLQCGQRAVGGWAYSPTIITGSIGSSRTGGAGPAAGVPSILQHQPVAPPGGAQLQPSHLMSGNRERWVLVVLVACTVPERVTLARPPHSSAAGGGSRGSSVTSRSGDVCPAFTTSCAAATLPAAPVCTTVSLRIRPQDVPAPATSLPSGMPPTLTHILTPPLRLPRYFTTDASCKKTKMHQKTVLRLVESYHLSSLKVPLEVCCNDFSSDLIDHDSSV